MEGAVAFRIAVTVIRRSGGWSDGRGEHRNALSTKELTVGVAVLAGVLSTLAVVAPA